jgi:hypothetical protein
MVGSAPNVRKSLNILITGLMTLGVLSSTSVKAEAQVIAQATATARSQHFQQQVRQVRPDNYDLARHPLTQDNDDFWENMLWTTAVVEPQEAYVADTIAQILALANQPRLSVPQQRILQAAMQVGTQLYLSNPTIYAPVEAQFRQMIDRSIDPEWVAMALSAIAITSPDQRQSLSDRVQQRFPRWSANVYLQTTLKEVANLDRPPAVPPLSDLLQWMIAPRQLQMYVLCPADRGQLCQAILKNGNGQFLRQNGQLWTVPLLLRSLHGLSWIFTRGQTPQGIYRIEGTRSQDTTTFRAYGRYPLIKLFVPLEDGVRAFLPGRSGTLMGGLAGYQALLPPSWRGYFPIQQSYWAGAVGRGLFRIHGSGEDPSFFTNNRRYPNATGWNPSIGCLSALELYNDAGQLQQADMPRILSALTTLSGQNFTGYLIVAEVPSSTGQPLSMAEIEAAIAQLPQP